MAKQRNIREMAAYIRASRSQVLKAHGLAMIAVTQEGERLAKQNAKAQFIGRNYRKLTGRLLNSIYSGYNIPASGTALGAGFVGVRGIPYGAIHEFGGTIRPVKAKQLWIKQHKGDAGKGRFKRMTPRQFFDAMQAQKGRVNVRQKLQLRFKNGKITAAGIQDKQSGKFTPLFFTADKSVIPARPYVTPAIREAIKSYPRVIRRTLGKLLTSNFFKK